MIFVEPPASPYDANFRLAGFPVRVHPGFWIAGLLLGFDQDYRFTLIWVGVVFISILVHELGHAVAARSFGGHPSIVLYWMGGLCVGSGERTRGQRAIVLASGPGAGLILAGLTVVAVRFGYGLGWTESLDLLIGKRFGLGIYDGYALRAFFYVNFFWSLVNCLPIWSLDGGQLLETALDGRHSSIRMQTVHLVSAITAGLGAYWLYQRGSTYAPVLFLFLGLSNVGQFLALRSAASSSYGRDSDSADWWRRS